MKVLILLLALSLFGSAASMASLDPMVKPMAAIAPLPFEITHINPEVEITKTQLDHLVALATWEKAPKLTSPGRCLWQELQKPVKCSSFPGLHLVSAKMKGIGFYNPKTKEKVHGGVLANEHAYATVPPSTEVLTGMLTFPHFGIDEDRNYAIKFSARTPVGGILHSRALCEYESARTLTKKGIPSIVPLAVIKYHNLHFEGQPMGAVISLQPEKESLRLSCLQYSDTNYGVSDEIDVFYDRIRAELKIEGDPTQETTRLAAISILSRQIGQLLRRFSLSGLYRHSSEWSNFEYSFDLKSIFFTDLDSTLKLEEVAPNNRILHVLRDLGTAVYRLVAKFGYPKTLESYTLGNILSYDPLCELLGGYFPEVDHSELQKVSHRLWRMFVPHLELLKRHKTKINGAWSRSERQNYKMDHELFYVLVMQSTWQFMERSEFMKVYPSDVTYETLDTMAQTFLQDRYEYLDYLLNDGHVDPSLAYLKKRNFEGRGDGVITTRAFEPGEKIFEGQFGRLSSEPDSHNSQMSEHVWMLHGGLSSFVNHCCDPNAGIRLNARGTHDLFCRKPIKPGEEVTFDYAMRNYIIKYMPDCACGSPNCRTKITGWKDLSYEQRMEYKDFSVPYVWELAERDEVRKHLAAVREKTSRLCREIGRAEPVIVAVSKTMPNHFIKAAYERGQLHFGENYLDELVQKAGELPDDILWHFLGSLPAHDDATALASIPNLALFESLDSKSLADALQKACIAVDRNKPLNVLVQVNTSGSSTTAGVLPGKPTLDLVKHIVENCPQLHFAGLMTTGVLGLKTDQPSPEICFEILNKCKLDAIKVPGTPDAIDFVVSMGMSGDFLDAIRCGSTNVRLGSNIFGARE